jgi:hypothetical protein
VSGSSGYGRRATLKVLLAALAAVLFCPGLPGRPGLPLAGPGGAAGTPKVEADTDPLTGSSTAIRGAGAPLLTLPGEKTALSREEVAGAGPLLVEKYSALLGIRPDQVRLLSADEVGGTWYLSYQQVVDGLGVYDSSLGFAVEPGGRIESLGARLYPGARVPDGPFVTRREALAAARGRIADYRKMAYRLRSESVVIYPARGERSVDYRRAYLFNFFPKKATHPAAPGGGWSILVDAGSKEIIAAKTLLKNLGCCLPPEGVPDPQESTKAKGGH